MGGLFRQLFAKLLKETKAYLTKKVDAGNDFSLSLAVDQNTISRGLKYSLATGNWQVSRKGNSQRTGVSQVLHHCCQNLGG